MNEQTYTYAFTAGAIVLGLFLSVWAASPPLGVALTLYILWRWHQ